MPPDFRLLSQFPVTSVTVAPTICYNVVIYNHRLAVRHQIQVVNLILAQPFCQEGRAQSQPSYSQGQQGKSTTSAICAVDDVNRMVICVSQDVIAIKVAFTQALVPGEQSGPKWEKLDNEN